MHKIGIHAQDFHPRLRYTVAFLNDYPFIQAANLSLSLTNAMEENDINIAYGKSPKGHSFDFFIPAQGPFLETAKSIITSYANAYSYHEHTVYSVDLEEKDMSTPLLVDRHFQFDIISTIFFHISRYEEVFANTSDQDESGWLKEDQHFLVKHQLEKQAVVDQLIAVFISIISGQTIAVKCTYDLTHDIDFLLRYPNTMAVLRAIAGSFYRREGLAAMRQHLLTFSNIQGGAIKDPFDCYDTLFSKHLNWKQKTLYLMAGGETAYDNHYRIEDPKIKNVLALAEKAGYTVGLHPSYNAGIKPPLFLQEKEQLEKITGQPIVNSRQHWLRFDWQITPDLLTQSGIQEDASLGYRRRLGFRCGTGFPYQLYDFKTERAFPWTERPLACMESAAIHEAERKSMDLIQLFEQFLAQNQINTHISINFHNSNFAGYLPYGRQLYQFYQETITKLGD